MIVPCFETFVFLRDIYICFCCIACRVRLFDLARRLLGLGERRFYGSLHVFDKDKLPFYLITVTRTRKVKYFPVLLLFLSLWLPVAIRLRCDTMMLDRWWWKNCSFMILHHLIKSDKNNASTPFVCDVYLKIIFVFETCNSCLVYMRNKFNFVLRYKEINIIVYHNKRKNSLYNI